MRYGHVQKHIEACMSKSNGSKYVKIRFSLPFLVQCSVCAWYSDKNTRVNAYKEACADTSYCGLEIYRFHIKCKKCKNTFTIMTDPSNRNYKTENNCKKINFADEDENLIHSDWENYKNQINLAIKNQRDLSEKINSVKKLTNVDIDKIIESLKSKPDSKMSRRQNIV